MWWLVRLSCSVMTMFKKYIQENEAKEEMNVLSLYLDIDAYNHMTSDGKVRKQKDTHATFICKWGLVIIGAQ